MSIFIMIHILKINKLTCAIILELIILLGCIKKYFRFFFNLSRVSVHNAPNAYVSFQILLIEFEPYTEF